MKREITYKNKEIFAEEVTDKLEKYIERKIQKLEKLLNHFPQDVVKLHITLERNPNRVEYQASFNLSLPAETLHATEKGDNLFKPLSSATDDLIRQIEKFKSKLLRKEHLFTKQEAPDQ